jgi:predicted ABC-type ATPase
MGRSALTDEAPVLLFLAGPNGAGKSTFFRTILQPVLGDRLPFVNADDMALALRDAAPERSTEDYERLAFAETEGLRRSMVAERLSFCTETVFSDPHGAKIGFLRSAQQAGYAVLLVFIGLESSELSSARVMQRVEEGGHDVADEKIEARFPRTMRNLASAVAFVDEAYLFDNSSDDDPFRPVAVYLGGQVVDRFEPIPAWAAGLGL